jgi:hypothetical protein
LDFFERFALLYLCPLEDPATKEGNCHDARYQAAFTVVSFRPFPSRLKHSHQQIAESDQNHRYSARHQAANDAQHASYWAQQDSNARNGAGFSNYLLESDRHPRHPGPKHPRHRLESHSDFWQKAFPDRIEEVPTSQYIKGQDF